MFHAVFIYWSYIEVRFINQKDKPLEKEFKVKIT